MRLNRVYLILQINNLTNVCYFVFELLFVVVIVVVVFMLVLVASFSFLLEVSGRLMLLPIGFFFLGGGVSVFICWFCEFLVFVCLFVCFHFDYQFH